MMHFTRRCRRCCAVIATALASFVLAGCGGGGHGNSGSGSGSGWVPGVFLDADTFAAQCVAPRSGTDPATGQPYPDMAGTRTDENNFLRSYSNETYLWYDEITDRDPSLYDSSLAYFDLLKTTARTASGMPKDRFHFTYPSDEWHRLSQSGSSAGYGAQWALLSVEPPRQALVAYTDPGTPAAAAGLVRGTEVLSIDGVDLASSDDVDTLNNGLFPAGAGERHTFGVRDPDGVERSVTLESEIVTSTPVQNVSAVSTATGNVGYLQFNDHIATAESALIDAVNTLAAADIVDLVVDIRYNGGGFLYIASEFAYMIAGGNATGGRTFESLEFNDKHPSTNPITGAALQPIPFYDTDSGNRSLPSLELPRVFVLTGPGTCSASESIINSLRGVDVEVVQIGSTTCGKPYGFYPTDNCGTTYFTIQFRGVNDRGFGDYSDGFTPANAGGTLTTPLPGCAVADDFTHALGDPLEARFAAALGYRANGACPAPGSLQLPGTGKPSGSHYTDQQLRIPRPPWREMRILEP